jgi:hypothetical protein
MTARLIAFTGYKGHGKSTAAGALMDFGAQRVRFAQPLKRMLSALGLSWNEIDGDLKEQPCETLGGKTPRHAMQTLGTQWGRDCIDQDFWIRRWQVSANNALAWGQDVVVDDLRFPNEAEAVRELGGLIVRIERPGHPIDRSHESERCVADIRPDAVILNNGSYEDLVDTVATFCRNLDVVGQEAFFDKAFAEALDSGRA